MRSKLICLIAICTGCFSLNSNAQSFKHEFGFKSDNDAYLFYGQDQYYTNGLFLYYRHAPDQQRLSKLEKITYEISAGQKMFNPKSGSVGAKEDQDRPFAAYLYGGGSVSLFYKKERVLKTTLELGVIGPEALGEETQKILHQIVGFYEINGWQYQIKNELAANLQIAYSQLLHRTKNNKIEFSFGGYGDLGTIYNGAGLSLVFRYGLMNQLFNTSYTQSAISHNSKTDKLVKKEFFFYARPQLSYVAYDATVQGSLFNHDSPVTFGTKNLVFAQQAGLTYSTPHFTLDYSLIFKSREIKSMAKAHQYGSISIFYRFN